MYDVLIIGAGPAGLSAGLILGRCRRRVLICDTGKPRNAASHALHGFLSRDGINPAELLKIGREQLCKYDTVELMDAEVIDAKAKDKGFEIELADGRIMKSRKLLIATGVVDQIPKINGIDELYGRSVFHCPYCDGWELRDQPIAIYGKGEHGKGLALELTLWSKDLVLCTDGPSELNDKDLHRLQKNGIIVREEKIAVLKGVDGILSSILFTNGESLSRRALFFSTGQHPCSTLAAKLGCTITPKGTVDTGDYEATNIQGVFVAGDASRQVQLVCVAVGEGAQAAFAINKALLKEDLTAN